MKTIFAAAIAAALFAPAASAADSTIYAGGAWTIRVEGVNPNSPADRARVVAAVRAAGLEACREELIRSARQACADDFAADALAGIVNPETRTALLHTLTGDSAVAVAAAR